MHQNRFTASYLQVLMALAGFYFLFYPLYGAGSTIWFMFLGILIFVNLAIWAVLECLPRVNKFTSLSSDLTPLLSVILPRVLVGMNIGSLLVTLQLENVNPMTDLVCMSFLLLTAIYVFCALFLFQVYFDETTLTYRGLLFSGQIQLHEVKEINKCVGLLYRIKYISKTHQGQLFFLAHFIDHGTVKGGSTSFRKFISCYLNANSKLRDNERV